MKIISTRRTDYAIRALIFLAQHDQGRRKALEIAEAMEIPKGFLHQVLQSLQRARLVVSQASRYGGYALARPAEEISLLEVIESMEGPFDTGACVIRPELCRLERGCALHSLWTSAYGAVAKLLGRATIAQIAASDLALSPDGKAVCPVTGYLKRKEQKKSGSGARISRR